MKWKIHMAGKKTLVGFYKLNNIYNNKQNYG